MNFVSQYDIKHHIRHNATFNKVLINKQLRLLNKINKGN